METETVTQPVSQDPFGAPAVIPSTYPSAQSFHGRLVLISPKRMDQIPNRQNPQKLDDRITADVTVVDGLGPVPLWKNRVQTGAFLDGPDFTGVYFSQNRIVKQLASAIPAGMVLARVGLYKEGQPQGEGNPWGLVDPTEEDKQMARNFLATRTVNGLSAPAPVAQPQAAYVPPVAPQPTPAYVPAPAPVPQGQAPYVPAPQPQPAYAQPAAQTAPPVTQPQMFTPPVQPQAPSAPVPGANPFV